MFRPVGHVRRGPRFGSSWCIEAAATAAVHVAHGAEVERGGVHERVAGALRGFGRGDRPVQLALDGLPAQLDHLIEGLGGCQILVIGIERGGVRLDKRVDLAAHARVERVEAAAVNILAYELLQIGVVLAVICLVLHQGIKEGRAGERVVDGIVHNTGSVIAAPHAAEGEVIIPRDEVQLSAGFIEVIVVRHGAGQAVFVDGEDVDGHIAEQVVDVHIIFQGITFRNVFESSDHALVVGLCGVGDLAVPDGLVAVQLIVCIIEVRAASAHGEATFAAAKAEIVRRAFSGGGRFLFRRRGIPIRQGHVAEIQITEIHIIGLEITAGFSPAADVHAVRLIELAVLHAVIAEQEAILHGLERKIDAPVFAIDGEFGVIVEGGVRAEVLVHIVDQRLFHIGGVGIVVVQDELIQTDAGLAVHVVVKLQLEAVAVGGGVIGDGGQAGVALGADDLRQKGVVFDFQNDIAGRVRGDDIWEGAVQKLSLKQARADVGIEGHADVPGGIDIRLAHVGHQHARAQLLRLHFAAQLPDQRLRMV